MGGDTQCLKKKYASPLPKEIIRDVFTDKDDNNKQKRLLIFAGAGVSAVPPTCIRTWKGLLQGLFDRCEAKIGKHSAELAKVQQAIQTGGYLRAQTFISQILGSELHRHLYDELTVNTNGSYIHNDIHEAIVNLNPKAILTTNYDQCFQQVLSGRNWLIRSSPDIRALDSALNPSSQQQIFWALHGTVGHPSRGSSSRLAFGQDGYESFYTDTTFKRILRQLFETCVVLFLGYSYSDPDLAWLLGKARREGFLSSKACLGYLHLVQLPDYNSQYLLRTIERIQAEGLNVLVDLDSEHGLSYFLERLFRAKQYSGQSISKKVFARADDVHYETIDKSYGGYSKSAQCLCDAWLLAEKQLGIVQTSPVLEVGAGSGISTYVFLQKNADLGRIREFIVIDNNKQWRKLRQYRLGLSEGNPRTTKEEELKAFSDDTFYPKVMRDAAKNLLSLNIPKYKDRIFDEDEVIDVRLARTFLGQYQNRIGVVLFASSMHWTAAGGEQVKWNFPDLLHPDALGELLGPYCLLIWNASAVQFNFNDRLISSKMKDEFPYIFTNNKEVKLNDIKYTNPTFFEKKYGLPDSPHSIFLKALQAEITRSRRLGRTPSLDELWGNDPFKDMYTLEDTRRGVEESDCGCTLIDFEYEEQKKYKLDWIPLTRTQVVDIAYGIGGFMRYFSQNDLIDMGSIDRFDLLTRAAETTNRELEKYGIRADDILGFDLFATFVTYRKI